MFRNCSIKFLKKKLLRMFYIQRFFSYFCNVFTPTLRLEVMGGGDRHINNGVSYALVLTIRSPGKTIKQCQEQSNEEARWVCCIYTAHVMLVSLWCIRTIGITGVLGLIYSYRREVRSCSFRQWWAILRRLELWSERRMGFTFFVYMRLDLLHL